ncbi:MAG: hypothetical protein MUP63_04185 [Candidatus Nanohaloarchaeota archaeon QJJ-7]|nr:hypothetical protein [Candidatus Nanohaloarchaeota archaeon QJJ-7]
MPNSIIEIASSFPVILPLLFLAVLVSYEDYTEGKIRNQYIAALIIGGAIYQFAFAGPGGVKVIESFLYGLGVSFLLYFLGIWPAGDAKLFSALILYFPASIFRGNMIMDYSINVFVPIFLVLGSAVLIRSGRERVKEAIEFSFDPYRVFSLAVILLGLVGFAMKGLEMIGIQGGFFLSVLLLFVAFEIFHAFLSAWTELGFTLLAALRIVVDYGEVFSLQYMTWFASLIIIFVVLRFFLLYLTYYYFSRDVEIMDLEPGMSTAEGIVDHGDHYGKVSFLNASLINYMMQRKENFIHDLVYLTEEDVERIKELKEEEELGFSTLRVDEKQHFALLIFLGYFLTMMLGGNFVTVVKSAVY